MKLKGTLTNTGVLGGKLSINAGYSPTKPLNLQAKMVIPNDTQQVITADSGYAGLSSVTVDKIPSNYGRITYDGIKILVE